MSNTRLRPVWYLVIGICFLIIPTAVYLGFLIPALKEEYIILLSSGGVVGSAGGVGSSLIPDKTRSGAIYKLASKSFTLLVVIALVQKFIGQLIGLAAVFICSYIIFLIFKELWKDGRRKEQGREIADEVSRALTKDAK